MRRTSRRFSSNLPGLLIAIAGVVVCLAGAWSSAREGLVQHYAGRALFTDSIADADRAVALGAAVPEAHYARGIVRDRTASANAVTEFESAVALRPSDYALWLEVGRAREEAGDMMKAVAAFAESARLAPFYAQPRWQLGNALFRAGRTTEALGELRRAAHSDARFALPALSLIWSALNADVAQVERAFAPHAPSMESALARFLVKREKIADAMRHFRAAGGIAPDEQRAMVTDLVAAGNFDAAYEVWASNRKNKSGLAEINNRGFEESIELNEFGFSWQLVRDRQGIQIALDPAERHSGKQSLRVDWSGNADPGTVVASQLLLVEPNARYQLKFTARGADIVMAGLPTVCVREATIASELSRLKPQLPAVCAPPLAAQTSGWQEYSATFNTPASTHAVVIEIRRETCAVQPCPAFGHAWFDDFSITKSAQ